MSQTKPEAASETVNYRQNLSLMAMSLQHASEKKLSILYEHDYF